MLVGFTGGTHEESRCNRIRDLGHERVRPRTRLYLQESRYIEPWPPLSRRRDGWREGRAEKGMFGRKLHDGDSLTLLTAFFLGILRVSYLHSSSNSAVAALLGALRYAQVVWRGDE